MKLRYTELKTGAAYKAGELKSQDFDLNAIIIGRGGNSNLILLDRSVSLQHAVLTLREDGKLVIRDLGSLAGVRINGQLQREATLSPNDIISIGKYELKLHFENEVWNLVYEHTADESKDHLVSSSARLELTSYLPTTTTLSYILVSILVLWYVARPLITDKGEESYSVGTLTAHHVFIGKDCSACHTDAFSPASDTGCRSCHQVSNHFKRAVEEKRSTSHFGANGTHSCIECHVEHKGQVTVTKNELCTNCHASIESVPDIKIKNVLTWKEHPEFRTPIDKGTVALNHAVHLKEGIQGDNGPETLTCASCHVMDPRGERMQPITYQANCSRCHTLEYDERLPELEVPHGDVQGVITALQLTYADLALRGTTAIVKGDADRLKKTQIIDAPQFTKMDVKTLVRDAEELLFTKTGCVLCHGIEEKYSRDTAPEGRPRFEIKKAAILSSWYPRASFAHAAHGSLKCDSCHVDVEKSKKTGDVLMPKLKNCAECHQRAEEISNCVTCHNYHDDTPFHFLTLKKSP